MNDREIEAFARQFQPGVQPTPLKFLQRQSPTKPQRLSSRQQMPVVHPQQNIPANMVMTPRGLIMAPVPSSGFPPALDQQQQMEYIDGAFRPVPQPQAMPSHRDDRHRVIFPSDWECPWERKRDCLEMGLLPSIGSVGSGAGGSFASGGLPAATPVLPFIGWSPTGSELDDNQKKSVQNAIDLIRCAGWEEDATFLAGELAEEDIEVMDPSPEQTTSRGLCRTFLGGEWIYLPPKQLQPTLPGARWIEPCDPAVVTLAAILVHEGRHATQDADETGAYQANIDFADDLIAKFSECFKDCTSDQRLNIMLRLIAERDRGERRRDQERSKK